MEARTFATHETSPASSLPGSFLKSLSKEILEHTKKLGIYDEIRMELIKLIEASSDFRIIENKFQKEVQKFCHDANLSLPRSKLRDRLNSETLFNSVGLLKGHVSQISSEQKNHLGSIYRIQAQDFLTKLQQGATVESNEDGARNMEGSTSLDSKNDSDISRKRRMSETVNNYDTLNKDNQARRQEKLQTSEKMVLLKDEAKFAKLAPSKRSHSSASNSSTGTTTNSASRSSNSNRRRNQKKRQRKQKRRRRLATKSANAQAGWLETPVNQRLVVDVV